MKKLSLIALILLAAQGGYAMDQNSGKKPAEQKEQLTLEQELVLGALTQLQNTNIANANAANNNNNSNNQVVNNNNQVNPSTLPNVETPFRNVPPVMPVNNNFNPLFMPPPFGSMFGVYGIYNNYGVYNNYNIAAQSPNQSYTMIPCFIVPPMHSFAPAPVNTPNMVAPVSNNNNNPVSISNNNNNAINAPEDNDNDDDDNEDAVEDDEDIVDNAPVTHYRRLENGQFQCTVPSCPRTIPYKSRSGMLHHIQTYHAILDEAQRPHRCSLCPKKYYQSAHLDRHVSSAHNPLLVCPRCNKQCTTQKRLEKHVLDEHIR